MMALRTLFMVLAGVLLAGPLQAAPETPAAAQPGSAVAVFAGGCFWCTESDFDKVPGVLSTTSGYIGGHVENPTYEDVSYGKSGHIEAVQVRYDSSKISYAQLLEVFWPTIDPITPNAQFCDKGPQYRSAIFYGNPQEQRPPRRRWSVPASCPGRCSRKSWRPPPSIRPRNTIRTTTAKIRSAMPTTVTAADAMHGWSSCGARRLIIDPAR